jgi:hypothetical protein
MLQKMQRLGCSSSTVGLVIPTGYSFNLDGTNIYMTMAAVFLAQATNTHLDLGQQLVILIVARDWKNARMEDWRRWEMERSNPSSLRFIQFRSLG